MDVLRHLQEHGIKPSVQRIAIMGYLMKYLTHPTADEIYTALAPAIPTLSRTTVYNTLRLLDMHGAVQTLTIDERRTCYDADTHPHAHFLCKQCGRIYDLPDTPAAFPADTAGHRVHEAHYYYKGICQRCLSLQTPSQEDNNQY